MIRCADDHVLPVGELQGDFLLARDHIEPTIIEGVYASHYTMHELHAIVLSESSLRECDFCGATPGGWRIPCQPFHMRNAGLLDGGQMGGPLRPVFACTTCARYVRANERRQLVEHAMDQRIEYARERGLLDARISKERARAALRLTVGSFIADVFVFKTGPPERDE